MYVRLSSRTQNIRRPQILNRVSVACVVPNSIAHNLVQVRVAIVAIHRVRYRVVNTWVSVHSCK